MRPFLRRHPQAVAVHLGRWTNARAFGHLQRSRSPDGKKQNERQEMARDLTHPRAGRAEPRGSCREVAVQPRRASVHMGVEFLALLPVPSYRYGARHLPPQLLTTWNVMNTDVFALCSRYVCQLLGLIIPRLMTSIRFESTQVYERQTTVPPVAQ